jgi:hypothetical protein
LEGLSCFASKEQVKPRIAPALQFEAPQCPAYI